MKSKSQQNLYCSNIVGIKSKFPLNLVRGRNKPNLEVIHVLRLAK